MAAITLPVVVSMPSLAQALQSVSDLAALFVEIPSDFTERLGGQVARDFCDRSMAGDDCLDLLFREPVCLAASGANKVEGFEFNPSDGYLELFTAVAADRKAHVSFSHGWPFLSVGTDSLPTVTEAGGVRNSTGGGF